MKNFKRNFKILLIILSIIMLIISIYKIKKVYALFQSELKGVLSKELGKWEITVNNTVISSGIEQNFIVDTFNIEENEYIKEDRIAPGLEGNFEIIIDPGDTDVSIIYRIEIDTSKIEDYCISIESVDELENSNELIEVEPNVYEAIIPLQNIKNDQKDTVRITFNWENNEDYNEFDTEIGTKLNSKLQIPITVKVSQYLGEDAI